jgi:hypothetical protein
MKQSIILFTALCLGFSLTSCANQGASTPSATTTSTKSATGTDINPSTGPTGRTYRGPTASAGYHGGEDQ